MTLPDLLIRYGVTSPADLFHLTGINRTYCYLLWDGRRTLGTKLINRLHTTLGIPKIDLLEATKGPPVANTWVPWRRVSTSP